METRRLSRLAVGTGGAGSCCAATRGQGGIRRGRTRATHRYTGVLAGSPLCGGDAADSPDWGREGWRLLREMCGDIVKLRKGDHSAERLQIERERLELEKKKARQRFSGEGLSAQERARRRREIFGVQPEGKRNGGLTDETLTEI